MVNMIILLLMVGIDLVSKSLAFATLPVGSKTVILPFLSLCLAQNYGVGFGLGSGFSTFILVSNIIILAAFLYYFVTTRNSKVKLITLFILAGGLGNCYDRLIYGFVRDFVLLSWDKWSWPIFNIADIYITIAFMLVLFSSEKSLPLAEPAQEQKA